MNSFGFMVCALVCVAVVLVIFAVMYGHYFSFKRAEKERLRELDGERKLYEKIYNASSEVYLIVGASDKIVRYVSSGSQELLGIKRADIMTDVYALKWVVVPSDVYAFNDQFEKWDRLSVLEREFGFVHMTTGDQKVGKVSISYNRIDDSFCMLIRDITTEAAEKQRATSELEQIRNMNKYRNEFISNISHEIRTPINSIRGQLKLVEMNAEKTDEVKRYAAGISEQTDILLGLLNDMFDISRLEAGDVDLEINEFDLLSLAHRLRESHVASAMNIGREFSLDTVDLRVRYLMGDVRRLEQILMAFLSYAEDVTPNGGKFYLNIRQMNKETDKVNLLFRIKDGGPRLTREQAAAVFETGSHGSIAMTVASQLIRVMGGQLMMDNKDDGNDYSIFITFPLSDRIQDMSQPIESSGDIINKDFTFEGCKILMAEDNVTNAEISKELLEMMGASVDIAENGAVAFNKFMHGGVGRYDVILMDIQMPEMDGYEAARRIRALSGAEAKKIPIIALSANAFVEDKNRSLSAGMNGHLIKPMDLDALKAELAKYL